MRNKIIYWVATVWMALGMVSTGLTQLFQVEEEVAFILKLGYPAYFLTLLGISKLLGTLAIFLPRTPLLKEWAYAGFFFTMAGAIYSHLVAGSAMEALPPLLLITLTMLSWYFRPAGKKVPVALD